MRVLKVNSSKICQGKAFNTILSTNSSNAVEREKKPDDMLTATWNKNSFLVYCDSLLSKKVFYQGPC